ncbi:kinetochore-associated protein 1-like isoform X2 [Artemia franciscana]
MFHVASKRMLFRRVLNKSPKKPYFVGGMLQREEADDKLMLVSSDTILHEFSECSITKIHEHIGKAEIELADQANRNIKYEACQLMINTKGISFGLFDKLDLHFSMLLLVDPTAVYAYSLQENKIIHTLSLDGIKKVIKADETSIIALTQDGYQYHICGLSFLIIGLEKNKKCSDILVLKPDKEDENPVLMSVSADIRPDISLRSFPDFSPLFKMDLHGPGFLVESSGSHDSILFLDGARNEDLPIMTSLRLRAMAESDIEAKLRRMINRGKYSEAMKLTKLFNMPFEGEICEAQVRDIIGQLNYWNTSLSTNSENVFNLWNELVKCIALIENTEFLVLLVENAALPEMKMMDELFNIVLNKVGEKGLKSQLGNMVKRRRLLRTYDKVLGEKALEAWYNKSVTMIDIVKCLLAEARTSDAIFFWWSHRYDIARLLTEENLVELLSALEDYQDSTTILHFLSRLCHELKGCHPQLMQIFIEWVVIFVRSLERRESEKWPQNAQSLLKAILACLDDEDETSVDIKPLLIAVGVVNDLLQLMNEFRIRVPYVIYAKDDKLEVLWLLCNTLQPTEIIDLVKNFLSCRIPCLGDLIFKVAEKLINETVSLGSLADSSSWEDRIQIFFDLLESNEKRLDLLILALDAADVPWSPIIQHLAAKGLDYDHPKSAVIRHKETFAKLETLLKKYNLSLRKATSKSEKTRLIRWLLASGHKDSYEDAYKIVDLLEGIERNEVAWWYILEHIRKGRMTEALGHWSNLPESHKAYCAEQWVFMFISIFEMRLRRLNPVISKDMKSFAGGLNALKVYYQSKNSMEMVKRVEIHQRLFNLHDKYDIIISGNDFLDKECCKLALSHFCANKLTRGDNAEMIVASVLIVGEEMNLSSYEVLSKLIFKAIELKHYEAIEVAGRYMLKVVPHQDFLADLYIVVLKIFQMLTMEPESKKLADLAFEITQSAATYCREAMLQDFSSLSRWCYLTKVLCAKVIGTDQQVAWASKDPFATWSLPPSLHQDHDIPFKTDDLVSLIKECINALFPIPIEMAALPFTCLSKFGIVYASSGNQTPESEEGKDFMAASILSQLSTPAMNLHATLTRHQQDVLALLMLTNIAAESRPFLSYVPENVCASFWEKHSLACQSNSQQLLQRILLAKVPDFHLALGCSKLMDQRRYRQLLGVALQRYQNDPLRLRSVAHIATKFSEFCSDPEYSNTSVEHLKCAEWAFRLLKMDIPCNANGLRARETETIVQSLATRGELRLLDEFRTAFNLDVSELLLQHLSKTLTTFRPCTIEEVNEQWPPLEKSLMKILRYLPSEHSLVCVLTEDLNKVSDYNYEVLKFILEVLYERKDLLDQPSRTEQALKLLRFLTNYVRISPPTQQERENWCKDLSGYSMPALSTSRLPFTLLESSAIRKNVLTPELSLRTWKLWVEVSAYLNMSSDEIAFLAGKNAVPLLANCRTLDELANVFPDFKECVSTIQDSELFLGCLNWATNELPKGSAKLAMAKYAVESEEAVRGCQLSDPRARSRYETVVRHYRLLAAEDILDRYGYLTAETQAIRLDPKALIASIFNTSTARSKILALREHELNKAIDDICQLFELDSFNARCELLVDWLSYNSAGDGVDLDETFVPMKITKIESGTQSNCGISSVMNLIIGGPLMEYMKFFYNFITSTDVAFDAQFKLNALKVLLIASSEQTLQELGTTFDELRSLEKSLRYAVRLERLCLPVSVSILESSNKWIFVQRLTSGNASIEFVQLAFDLVKDYLPNDVTAWETILGKSIKCNEVSLLEDCLTYLSMVPTLWASPIYVEAWNQYLQLVLNSANLSSNWNEEEEFKIANRLGLILQCPDLEKINFNELIQLALFCPEPALALVLLPYAPEDVRSQALQELGLVRDEIYLEEKRNMYSNLGLPL